MKALLSSLFIALAAFTFVPEDAEAAKRLGGGRSTGMQRQATPQQTPQAPQQQMAPAAPKATPAAPAAQQPAGWRRFLGPLAGLAIGAGLASLFFNNGMGGALLGMLLIAALVMGAVMLVRMFRGRQATSHQPLQYAGAGANAGAPRAEPIMTPPSSSFGGGAASHSVAAATQLPADFNAEEFVRHAKLNFVKLQEANDKQDIDALRDFLTPDLLNELAEDMRASAGTEQKTDVVTLDADVLDVAAENGLYIVSVRFSGLIRESGEPQPQPFSETWHLQKPVSGRSGWLVAGIQQQT